MEKICKLMKDVFIKNPNLPKNKVTLAAVGDYPHIIRALHNEGIETVSFHNPHLSDETIRHQDMLLCHTGDDVIFLDPSQDKAVLTDKGFKVYSSAPLKKDYPDDVKLNCAVSEKFFVCNKKSTDRGLLEALTASGKTPLFVNQGYSKCSVCFVTENAVITEDTSIKAAIEDIGADVLLISKGDIYLSDTHYGFFGGSSGKISKNTLAVTGSLQYHKDGEKIRDFCTKHGVFVKELTDGKIIDIGSLLPLKEMR